MAWQFSIKTEAYKGLVGLANDNVIIGLVSKMITNDNKGTYLVKNDQKYDNVIYEWSLTNIRGLDEKILDFIHRDLYFDKFEASTKTYFSSANSSVFAMMSRQVL